MGEEKIRIAVVKNNIRHNYKPESRIKYNTIVDEMSNETRKY